MPVDANLSLHQWERYSFIRDNGHADFIRKADKCNDFFVGRQWDRTDLALLTAHKRPALTINKIISTVSNVMGEQIHNRSDITYLPRSGAPIQTAEAITKIFRQISDNNQLDWKRSDMFCDGIISSRGFLDVRLGFTDSMQGEVEINDLNPKNVLIDPDAEDYDPDTWNDVMTTKWLTWQDIKLLYNAADAEYLKARGTSSFMYGYDSIERDRDRFGHYYNKGYNGGPHEDNDVLRNIRVIERQWKRLDNQTHFLDPKTGDTRPVPESWDREKVAYVSQQFGLTVIKKLTKRIRWTVTADNVVLHDEWSPYKHFTVVPYFPYFRRGQTVGMVENLLGPQEYLNKVTSQELHVINTTANSGWIVQTNKMRNMTIEELEQRGAETGLVIEVDGSVGDAIEKIQPNPTPTGLDRFSYKAEEHIKNISGVTDYMSGNAREDVSAKAVAANTSRGSLNLSKPLDGIARTDYILARNILDIVQEYYTEPRILNVISNRMTGESEQVAVNQPDPATGAITMDLTMGEFDVVVSSTPHRETLEDSQFEQAVSLRELGVQIPDQVLIENSRLNKRGDIIKQMNDAAQSPEAQYKAQIQKLQAELELANLKADATATGADAQLKQAKAQSEMAKAQNEANGNPAELQKIQMEIEQKQQEMELDRQKMEMELQFKREELELKKEELQLKLQTAQVQANVKVQGAQIQAETQQAAGAMKMDQAAQEHAMTTEQAAQQHAQTLQQNAQAHKNTLKQGAEVTKAKVSQAKALAKAKPKPKAGGSK